MANPQRRVLGNPSAQRLCRGEVFAFRRDLVDDIDRLGFLGGKETTRQADLHRERSATAEIQQRPVFRARQAARRFGDLKARAFLGHDQVAFQRDTECKAQHVAVHRGDHRLPVDAIDQQVLRIGITRLRAAVLFHFLTRAQLPLLHIGA